MQRALLWRGSAVARQVRLSSGGAGGVPVKPSSSQTEVLPKPGSTTSDQLQYDQVTHTGQAWDKEDYRLARFVELDKQVNPNVAMNLIAGVAPTAVASRIATCDGGGGALGHPKVFINLDKPGNHACGYCGLRFFQDGAAHDGSEHIQV